MKFHVMHEICMKLDILCSRKSAGKVIPMVIPMSTADFILCCSSGNPSFLPVRDPWERIHFDCAGPFQNAAFVVAVDAHCNWSGVFIMTSTTTTATSYKCCL